MLIRFGDEPQLSQFGLLCNTEDAGLFSNVSTNLALGLPEIQSGSCPAIICGGGPSLAGTLANIRTMKKAGGKVFALNNTARFLTEHGIRPDVQIIVDPRAQNVVFLDECWADEVLLASQCHPDLFARAKAIGYPVRIWHPAIQGMDKYVTKGKKCFIGGGMTVGLSGLCLVFAMGHREIHLFGYDSSHAGTVSHAYAQDMNKSDELVRCVVDSKAFDCSLAMAGQANYFKPVSEGLIAEGAELHVHGDGLVPTLWRMWQREKTQRVLTAVYDLGMSPPTYDVTSFLVEAERHRIAEKFDLMDVVFQPGPMHGFRDDDLPPDLETRKAMLWRVCAGMARLVPSVRHVTVLGERRAIQGDVFPVGYAEDSPKSHYAIAYLKDGKPLFKASEYARRQVAKRFSKPYATISMREAQYWPERNSRRFEWAKVCDWFRARGIQPVVVPDTDGAGLSAWGGQEFTAASFDIDLRAALYEGALINLGVSNGPMAILPFLDARYLIFNVGVSKTHSATSDFLKAHGFEKDGPGMGGNGRMVWAPDIFENIIAELTEFTNHQPECVSSR